MMPPVMDSCSSSALLLELGVISELWQTLESVLCSGISGVQCAMRSMQDRLPPIQELELRELPALANMHMSSAASLMKTQRLLTPHVYTDDTGRPDEVLFLQMEGSQLELVSILIELQLFHMLRASALVAAAKKQLRGRAGADAEKETCHMHGLHTL